MYIDVQYGAWHSDKTMQLKIPDGWSFKPLPPSDGIPIGQGEIRKAIKNPIGSERIRTIAGQKKTAVIVIDDITRPTPVGVILPFILDELLEGGISRENICVLIGTGAHREMTEHEMTEKIGLEIVRSLKVVCHDFLGNDIVRFGWVDGGPVFLNRHFMEADLRICVGCVMPHNETGYGGGAKLVVPGVAGHKTIAYFHGALPPRKKGVFGKTAKGHDRRSWAEKVARQVGVDTVVCAVVNSKAKLTGIYVGEVVAAHKAAAEKAFRVGRTIVDRNSMTETEIVLANAFPLDTDPMQMGKSIKIARELAPRHVITLNAASDGVFYHGMGMGCGISLKRIAKNIPSILCSPNNLLTWLRSMATAMGRPESIARLAYYSLNHSPYNSGDNAITIGNGDNGEKGCRIDQPDILTLSKQFPGKGYYQKYPKGALFRDWTSLCAVVDRLFPSGATVAYLPCAPLQFLPISYQE